MYRRIHIHISYISVISHNMIQYAHCSNKENGGVHPPVCAKWSGLLENVWHRGQRLGRTMVAICIQRGYPATSTPSKSKKAVHIRSFYSIGQKDDMLENRNWIKKVSKLHAAARSEEQLNNWHPPCSTSQRLNLSRWAQVDEHRPESEVILICRYVMV